MGYEIIDFFRHFRAFRAMKNHQTNEEKWISQQRDGE